VKYIGGGNEMHCGFIFGTNLHSLSCVTLLVYPDGNNNNNNNNDNTNNYSNNKEEEEKEEEEEE